MLHDLHIENQMIAAFVMPSISGLCRRWKSRQEQTCGIQGHLFATVVAQVFLIRQQKRHIEGSTSFVAFTGFGGNESGGIGGGVGDRRGEE